MSYLSVNRNRWMSAIMPAETSTCDANDDNSASNTD